MVMTTDDRPTDGPDRAPARSPAAERLLLKRWEFRVLPRVFDRCALCAMYAHHRHTSTSIVQ
jgi:hypothetical protein